jgi:hypothetical protein
MSAGAGWGPGALRAGAVYLLGAAALASAGPAPWAQGALLLLHAGLVWRLGGGAALRAPLRKLRWPILIYGALVLVWPPAGGPAGALALPGGLSLPFAGLEAAARFGLGLPALVLGAAALRRLGTPAALVEALRGLGMPRLAALSLQVVLEMLEGQQARAGGGRRRARRGGEAEAEVAEAAEAEAAVAAAVAAGAAE